MKTVHTLSATEVITALTIDHDSICEKKKLLINNNDIPYDDRVSTLNLYNAELTRIEKETKELWETECTDNTQPEQFHL